MPVDPIWRKAPLLLGRFAQILVAVSVGAMILAATAAARPGYLASSGRAAVAQEIADFSRWGAGVAVVRPGSLARPVRVLEKAAPGEVESEVDFALRPLRGVVDEAGRRLAELLAPVPGLDPPVLFMAGAPLRAAAVGGSGDAQARLAYRDDWLGHVTAVAGGPGDGVWVSDVTASQIGVEPGDEIVLRTGGDDVLAPVSGIYRFLPAERRREAWLPVSELVYKAPNADTYPPPFVLAPRELFFALGDRLGDSGIVQWAAPVRAGEMSLEDAAAMAARLERLVAGHLTGFEAPLVRLLGVESFTRTGRAGGSEMDSVVRAAREQVAALRGPVDVVAIAAAGVAAAILVAAGFYLVQRRRTEFASLVQRGASPLALAARAGVELVLPVALGSIAGAAAGLSLGGGLGPGRGFPHEAVGDAVRAGAVALLLGLAVASAAVFLACRAQEAVAPARAGARRPTWEVAAALAVALVAWLVAGAGGVAEEGARALRLDVLLLPLVGVGAAGALAARGAQGVLGAAGTRLPVRPPVYLAFRRLANSSGAAIALVAACAFSIGVFTYAAVLEASTEQSARRKAYLFAGADAAALVAPGADAAALDVPSTSVLRFERFGLTGALDTVPMIGVDPTTFTRAAYWQNDFADRPIAELMASLARGPDDAVPVIAVAGATVPEEAGEGIEVVARADAFPGQVGSEPVLVGASDRLLEALSTGAATSAGRADEIWMRASPDEAAAALARAEIPYYSLRSAAAVLETPSLQSLSWALALLRALGIGAAALSVVGLLLYLQARERATTVTIALARRMRLSRRAHLQMLVTENIALLALGLLSGALAGGAIVALLLPRFDLLSTLPPSPVLVLPLRVIAVVALAVLALGVAGAWYARAASARRNVVEVLRETV